MPFVLRFALLMVLHASLFCDVRADEPADPVVRDLQTRFVQSIHSRFETVATAKYLLDVEVARGHLQTSPAGLDLLKSAERLRLAYTLNMKLSECTRGNELAENVVTMMTQIAAVSDFPFKCGISHAPLFDLSKFIREFDSHMQQSNVTGGAVAQADVVSATRSILESTFVQAAALEGKWNYLIRDPVGGGAIAATVCQTVESCPKDLIERARVAARDEAVNLGKTGIQPRTAKNAARDLTSQRQALEKMVAQSADPTDIALAREKFLDNPLVKLLARAKPELEELLSVPEQQASPRRSLGAADLVMAKQEQIASVRNGLRQIAGEVFSRDQDVEKTKRNLGRLMVINPSAAAAMLMENPQLLRAYCDGLHELARDQELTKWLNLGLAGLSFLGFVAGPEGGLATRVISLGARRVLLMALNLGSGTALSVRDAMAQSELADMQMTACYIKSASKQSCSAYGEDMETLVGAAIASGLTPIAAGAVAGRVVRMARGQVGRLRELAKRFRAAGSRVPASLGKKLGESATSSALVALALISESDAEAVVARIGTMPPGELNSFRDAASRDGVCAVSAVLRRGDPASCGKT